MPPAVALLNYISCGILWRIFSQTGIFAGFSLRIFNLYRWYDQRSCDGRVHYIFSLAGPVGDYTGAHTAIIRGVFVYKSQWYSGKINAPGSPRSGLKRSILFLEVSRGFLCISLISSRRISEAAMGGAGAIYFLVCRVVHLE